MGVNWGQGGKGAVGGAAMGATVAGPYGAVIGGALGGIAGLFSGGGESDGEKKNREALEQYYNEVRFREAPQMGPAAQGNYSSFRNNQSELVGRLDAMSKGQGPSLAAEQFKSNTDRLGAQQASVANSGRGGPLAAQTAANNMALQGSQASQGAVQGRIAEQNNALQQLGLTIYGARGADEQMNQFNASQKNEQAAQNLAARLKTMGYNDAAIQQTLSQLGGKATNLATRPGEGDAILGSGMSAYTSYASSKAGSKGSAPASQPTGNDYLNQYWRQQMG